MAAELGRLLSARGFERWLVAEALDRLAEGASATLHVLSGGQFSLVIDADGEFAVVDHGNGDELRPVRTLSGGETFQASLALALALADELVRAWPRAGPRSSMPSSSTRASAPSTRRASTRWPPPSSRSGRAAGWWASSPTSASWRRGCRSATRSRKGPTTSTVERVAG